MPELTVNLTLRGTRQQLREVRNELLDEPTEIHISPEDDVEVGEISD